MKITSQKCMLMSSYTPPYIRVGVYWIHLVRLSCKFVCCSHTEFLCFCTSLFLCELVCVYIYIAYTVAATNREFMCKLVYLYIALKSVATITGAYFSTNTFHKFFQKIFLELFYKISKIKFQNFLNFVK